MVVRPKKGNFNEIAPEVFINLLRFIWLVIKPKH